MARHYFRILAVAAVAFHATSVTATGAGPRPGPSVRVSPDRVRPGDALLVTLDGVPTSSVPSMSGTGVMKPSPRPLRFYPTPGGAQAILALPVELEPGPLRIEVRVPDRAEPLVATVDVVEPAFPVTTLAVEPKYIAPSPAQKRQMEEDQAAFREAFARPFEPPLFSGPFTLPRDSRVTGAFGEKRVFNGEKRSQHYGTDLAGAVGDPVRATNDGIVVLVRDCFASGRSIAVAHGGGLFSVYFHLSEIGVRAGDRVVRGQPIGKVGATGRVTGPHLHFGIKVVDVYVDPDSVYRLAFAPPAPGSAPPAPPK
jgi:murein DD-endopeptidase MepM/ murein hydrolase activator NlpD